MSDESIREPEEPVHLVWDRTKRVFNRARNELKSSDSYDPNRIYASRGEDISPLDLRQFMSFSLGSLRVVELSSNPFANLTDLSLRNRIVRQVVDRAKNIAEGYGAPYFSVPVVKSAWDFPIKKRKVRGYVQQALEDLHEPLPEPFDYSKSHPYSHGKSELGKKGFDEPYEPLDNNNPFFIGGYIPEKSTLASIVLEFLQKKEGVKFMLTPTVNLYVPANR